MRLGRAFPESDNVCEREMKCVRAREEKLVFDRVMRQKCFFSFSAKSKTLRCDVHQGEAGLLLLMDLAPVSAKPRYYRSISHEACVSLCFPPPDTQPIGSAKHQQYAI